MAETKNAKDELLQHLKENNLTESLILCADIYYEKYHIELPVRYTLLPHFTNSEFLQFLETLNFEYRKRSGLQSLFGTIWYKNDTWSERSQYEGLREEWIYQKFPDIPFKKLEK